MGLTIATLTLCFQVMLPIKKKTSMVPFFIFIFLIFDLGLRDLKRNLFMGHKKGSGVCFGLRCILENLCLYPYPDRILLDDAKVDD